MVTGYLGFKGPVVLDSEAKTLLQEGGYWGIRLQRDQTIHIVIPQAMIDTLW